MLSQALKKFLVFSLLLFAAVIIAGVYGAVHDQISYTVSPEYSIWPFGSWKELVGQRTPVRVGHPLAILSRSLPLHRAEGQEGAGKQLVQDLRQACVDGRKAAYNPFVTGGVFEVRARAGVIAVGQQEKKDG